MKKLLSWFLIASLCVGVSAIASRAQIVGRVVDLIVATTCTNQFVRSLAATGAGTCASVAIGSDVSGLGTGVATALGTPSTANLASAFNTAVTATTPTPTAGSGTFTSASSAVMQQLIPGNLIYVRATVTITTVGTGATSMSLTVPTAASSSTACSAMNSSNGTVNMVAQISGTTLTAAPTAGTITSGNFYLISCLYLSSG